MQVKSLRRSVVSSRLLGIALLLLVQGMAGCGDDSRDGGPVGPTTSTPTATATTARPTPPPSGDDVIRGIVYDTALRPLDGARVEVLDGPQAGTSTTSNGDGGFWLAGTFDDTTRFRATREGHVAETATLRPCIDCNGWRLYFGLDLLVPPVSLAGDYSLTFIAHSACEGLPEYVRTRTYAATVTSRSPSDRPATAFDVSVSGASFRNDLAWGGEPSLRILVAGDYLTLGFADFHGSPGLVEQLTANTYLALSGMGGASVGAITSDFSIPFTGVMDYCATTSEMKGSYACTPGPGVVQARCDSNHRAIFTRR
jgi:hypothetical protein